MIGWKPFRGPARICGQSAGGVHCEYPASVEIVFAEDSVVCCQFCFAEYCNRIGIKTPPPPLPDGVEVRWQKRMWGVFPVEDVNPRACMALFTNHELATGFRNAWCEIHRIPNPAAHYLVQRTDVWASTFEGAAGMDARPFQQHHGWEKHGFEERANK